MAKDAKNPMSNGIIKIKSVTPITFPEGSRVRVIVDETEVASFYLPEPLCISDYVVVSQKEQVNIHIGHVPSPLALPPTPQPPPLPIPSPSHKYIINDDIN
jgi:hypothetical protein